MRARTSSVLLAGGVAAASLVTAQPAAAADHLRCTSAPAGTRICVGVQTTGGDVRGYGSLSDPSGGGDLSLTVRSLVLQRRACGGAWQTWTTTRTTGDASRTKDTDVTQWVVRPAGYQFRSVVECDVASTGPSGTAQGGREASPAFGAC